MFLEPENKRVVLRQIQNEPLSVSADGSPFITLMNCLEGGGHMALSSGSLCDIVIPSASQIVIAVENCGKMFWSDSTGATDSNG